MILNKDGNNMPMNLWVSVFIFSKSCLNLKKNLFIFSFIYISWRLITLQHCSGFAIGCYESAMDLHVLPILNPPPSSLPIPSLWVIPVHQPWAPCLMQKSCLNFNGPNIIKNINFHLEIILGRPYLFKLPIKSNSSFTDLIKLKYFKRLFYSQMVYLINKKVHKILLKFS